MSRWRLLSDEGVIREEGGRFWLLNRQARGFGEFGYWFPSLDDVVATVAIEVLPPQVDKHGPYWPTRRVAD